MREGRLKPGDILVLIAVFTLGSGIRISELTSALKHLKFRQADRRHHHACFSGVSTGGNGHVTPEALAGGPVGKVLEGDEIEIMIDCERLEGSIDLSEAAANIRSREGARMLELPSAASRSEAP